MTKILLLTIIVIVFQLCCHNTIVSGRNLIRRQVTDTDYEFSDGNNSFSVACAFNSWSVYRRGKGRFTPEDIDPDLCTDIFYDYAILDPQNLLLTPRDLGADINILNLYKRIMTLKKSSPSLRVHLSVGGMEESGTDKFSRLVNDPLAREHFVHHASIFLPKLGFDGLNIAWFFPVCWRGNCTAGPTQDKENFVLLIQELRNAFDSLNPPLLLSASVSGNTNIIEQAYDTQALGRLLDRIDIMAYDFSTFEDGKTGLSAPMFSPTYGLDMETMHTSVQHWLRNVPSEKILVGIPTYGQTFTLKDPNDYGVNAPVSGPGQLGRYYQEMGKIAFYEICDGIKSGNWRKMNVGAAGLFAYKDDQWVSFDGVEEVGSKAEYIRYYNLGGATIQDLTTDDFNATCCQQKFPLLNIVSYELLGRGNPLDC